MEMLIPISRENKLPTISSDPIVAENPTQKFRLPAEDDATISTLKSLRSFADIPLDNHALGNVCNLPSYAVFDPIEKTMVRIIERYRWILTDGYNTTFHLSSNSLAGLVENIDVFPKSLGFHYPRVLRHECTLIVPQPVEEKNSLEQTASPVQIFRMNSLHLQCRFLGTSLLLMLMHRFIRYEKSLSSADWTPLMTAVKYAPIEQIPLYLNQAVLTMTKRAVEVEKCKK